MAQQLEKLEPDETNLGKRALWAGIIGAPMVWLTQFLICYALVPYVCHTRKFFSLHLTIALALIIVAGAEVLCWREWKDSGERSPQSDDGGRIGSARLAAVVGLLSSSLVFLLILAQGIATFMVDPCAN
jgi:hypothetical protein